MKRRKKLPYVIIILACIFLLIPFAATLVYSFTNRMDKTVSCRMDF